MRTRIRLGLLALAATFAACDRPAPTAETEGTLAPPSAQDSQERDAMDHLARRFARALADPGFRAFVKGQLDQSPYVEHKLQLQRFLHGSGQRALKEVARLNGTTEAMLEGDAERAIPLEFYFPVAAHRAAWSGGPDLLVASARQDHDAPIAYDVNGRRQVLSPDAPPATPVLAIVPVETNFGPDGLTANQVDPIPPPPPPPIPPPLAPHGLYMSYAHFVQDFEGWFKGNPEFEIHILGQSGTTDSLRDYQCAGEPAGGYYRFDQNSLTWSGAVLLFSQSQLSSYKTAHPNQNFRIVALEDDDTGCVIKFDSNRFKNLVTTFQTQYPNLTGAKDTTSGSLVRYIKRANALQKILSAAYSFITTQDDLIGNAIEDVVIGVSYPEANWIVKGESNVTNGWIKLEMR
ncbi:MAG TPA: hypothetical protein VGN76_02020 [Gemmatimonadales bacterium]|jgi:hypothetical protein|nr:hypothetical protein [Gemmatimonadales bacterium]